MVLTLLIFFFNSIFQMGYSVPEIGHGSLPLAENTTSSGLIGKPAPEVSEGKWINSQPLRLSDLRGRVVLLEFWTYGCYNCRNTIPHLERWFEKYGSKTFEIVGVHSPEFEQEKVFSSLLRRTQELGIKYPVITDNELQTWNSYRQEYWPTLYLIDKNGIIRYIHIGEGDYSEVERLIQRLLQE